jgi:hypothetical protein
MFEYASKGPQLKLTAYSHNDVIILGLQRILRNRDLGAQLSAYCAALRIRFYLWRMTRPHPMCRLWIYKREIQAQRFHVHLKHLTALIAMHYALAQEAFYGDLSNVRRELVSDPVKVETIAKAPTSTEALFCTICQEEHEAQECVSLLKCACVFGRECLQPLLNRDIASSSVCPNCRTRIHEPLKWKPIEGNDESQITIGLLWGLRSNLACLRLEIDADPEPFTWRQRLAGWLASLPDSRLHEK